MLGIGGAKSVVGHADGVIRCESTAVFDFVGRGFFENYPKWCPQVVELNELSTPPLRLGTRGRQVTRDRGIDSESVFEVSAFAPTDKFEIKGVSEPFRSTYEVDGTGSFATQLSFTFELLELDLAMRPFQKLIRTALQEGALQTIENIRGLLEVPRHGAASNDAA
jgi:hypothetical protein